MSFRFPTQAACVSGRCLHALGCLVICLAFVEALLLGITKPPFRPFQHAQQCLMAWVE